MTKLSEAIKVLKERFGVKDVKIRNVKVFMVSGIKKWGAELIFNGFKFKGDIIVADAGNVWFVGKMLVETGKRGKEGGDEIYIDIGKGDMFLVNGRRMAEKELKRCREAEDETEYALYEAE